MVNESKILPIPSLRLYYNREDKTVGLVECGPLIRNGPEGYFGNIAVKEPVWVGLEVFRTVSREMIHETFDRFNENTVKNESEIPNKILQISRELNSNFPFLVIGRRAEIGIIDIGNTALPYESSSELIVEAFVQNIGGA